MRIFSVYRGLQKPLVFKSFKGKFIFWGVGSLLSGLVLGALCMVLINMYFGVLVLTSVMGGGLWYTAETQKKGLHSKRRSGGLYLHQSTIKLRKNVKKKRF
jgi:hypothetical protein